MAWDTKAEATKAGQALIKKLKGKGWKFRVWENLGWHTEAHLGRMSLYGGPDYWHTLLGKYGGEIFWTPNNKTFRDPNAAVNHQLKLANKFLKEQTKHIRYIKIALKR